VRRLLRARHDTTWYKSSLTDARLSRKLRQVVSWQALTGLSAAIVLAVLFSVPLPGSPDPVEPASASSLPATLTLVGHGWGHGRGMGQYGALGYSLAPYKWNYRSILAHYYGGTVLAQSAVATVPVNIVELGPYSSVTFSAPAGGQLRVNGVSVRSPDTLRWGAANVTVSATASASSTTPVDVIASEPASAAPPLAWTGRQRRFAGAIILQASTGDAINEVPILQYVEGVVPRESPASWPAAALEAQAVAARSYAIAYLSSHAAICDTTSCQVYGGDPTQYGAESATFYEQSNAAVVATGRLVLECGNDSACGSRTKVALTEFSSSTGGYTAGGAFPAVLDAGDATPSNPNHDWTASVSTRAVQAAFPSVGALQSVTVTGRNGLGDLGGRVTQMVLAGTGGRLTISGTQFAAALGLKSDWFAITNLSVPAGSDRGYLIVAANGAVYPFGAARSYGSMAGHQLNAPVLALAPTPDAAGYWLIASDGGIFTFGDAHFYGSTGAIRLNRPVVGMDPTAAGKGYWLVASDGGIFTFGDARFYGSTGHVRLAEPIVGMARTPDGKGYWLVASDGGIFTFGDARFFGSTGNVRLAEPIVGMVPTGDGKGYWLVGRDGGIFTFGDAGFAGSLPGTGQVDTITAVTPTPNGRGYVMVGAGGRAYAFGNATYLGDPATTMAGWSGRAIGISAVG
jgi:SpoIID/LytB domain protein